MEEQRYFLVALGNDQYIIAEIARRHPIELIAVTEVIAGAVPAQQTLEDFTRAEGVWIRLNPLSRYLQRKVR